MWSYRVLIYRVQNERQRRARRPHTAAPLTLRPRRVEASSNGFSDNVVTSTAMDIYPWLHIEDPTPSRTDDSGEMQYSDAGPSSFGPDRLLAPIPRDAYLAEQCGRLGTPTTQLPRLLMLGSCQRDLMGDSRWERPPQTFPSSPSTPLTSPPAAGMYRMTPPTSYPSSKQDRQRIHGLPWVETPPWGPATSKSVEGPCSTFTSLSVLQPSVSTSQSCHFDLPPLNIDFSTPRPPLNIPPPFTLQPQPLWDDPAFSPYSRHRRSPEQSTHSTTVVPEEPDNSTLPL